MEDSEIIIYKFPGGMNVENYGIVSELFIYIDQTIVKGQKLAICMSGDFEMEIIAKENGIVMELLVKKNQIVYQNDNMWKVKCII